MEWTLLFYVVPAAALALLLARRRRHCALPERLVLPQTPIIAEEWAAVRRRLCIPSGCPRAVGEPPRPRGDTHCEFCAVRFLDGYYGRLLGASDGTSHHRQRPTPLLEPLGDGTAPGRLLLLQPAPAAERHTLAEPGRHGERLTRPRIALGLLFGVCGLTMVAGVALLSLTPWVLSGYLALALGLAGLVGGMLASWW